MHALTPSTYLCTVQLYVGPTVRDYVPLEERPEETDRKKMASEIEHGGPTRRTQLATFARASKL